jgi:hypothetical protein
MGYELMKKQQYLRIIMMLGLLLVAIGITIWTISIIEIKSNELMLTQNLSIEDVWRYQGALQWWEDLYTTVTIPATSVLLVSGIVFILGSLLSK